MVKKSRETKTVEEIRKIISSLVNAEYDRKYSKESMRAYSLGWLNALKYIETLLNVYLSQFEDSKYDKDS